MARRNRFDAEIRALALPAFFTLIAEPIYLLTDTAVVGHLGTEQLAGLALAATILLIGHSLFIFLAYGTTAAVSRLLGAGHEAAAATQAIQGVWLAIGAGVVIAALGFATAEPLITALGGQGVVADHALLYLRISLFGFPAMLIALAVTGYLRGLQDTRTPLAIAIGGSLLNLILEVVLIYGFDFGLGASALATVVAQVVAAALFLRQVRRAVSGHGISLRPDRQVIGHLGRAGAHLLMRTAALRGSLVAATAIAARMGTPELAAHQIALEVWGLLALGLDSIAIAAQAMIGRLLGADQAKQARVAGTRLLEWGMVIGVVVGTVIMAYSQVLGRVFSDDPAVITLLGSLFLIVGAMQPLNALVFTYDGILIGAGDLRFLARAMVMVGLGFAVAATAVHVSDLGLNWLWGSLCLFMALRAITLRHRYRGTAWMTIGATVP